MIERQAFICHLTGYEVVSRLVCRAGLHVTGALLQPGRNLRGQSLQKQLTFFANILKFRALFLFGEMRGCMMDDCV